MGVVAWFWPGKKIRFGVFVVALIIFFFVFKLFYALPVNFSPHCAYD